MSYQKCPLRKKLLLIMVPCFVILFELRGLFFIIIKNINIIIPGILLIIGTKFCFLLDRYKNFQLKKMFNLIFRKIKNFILKAKIIISNET